MTPALWLVRVRRARKANEFRIFKREAAAWIFRTRLLRNTPRYILGVDIKPVIWENL